MVDWYTKDRFAEVVGLRASELDDLIPRLTRGKHYFVRGRTVWVNRPAFDAWMEARPRDNPPNPQPSRPVVYFIQLGEGGPIKIGFTTNLDKRIKALQTASPDNLILLAAVEGSERTERGLHARFGEHRQRGEWFAPAPEILEYIEECSQT